MTKRLSFTVGIPPTVNHSHMTTRNGKRIMRSETRDYKELTASTAALAAIENCFSFDRDTRLGLIVRCFFDRRGQDLDNRNKHLQDAIADGVGFNDKIIDELHMYRMYDKAYPRCEVELFDAANGYEQKMAKMLGLIQRMNTWCDGAFDKEISEL